LSAANVDSLLSARFKLRCRDADLVPQRSILDSEDLLTSPLRGDVKPSMGISGQCQDQEG